MTAATRRLAPLALAAALAAGCARPQPPIVPTKPPEVVVEYPFKRLVTEYEDFTGRTRASRAVDLKTQVTAELREVSFADGTDVPKDKLLFTLDTTLFQADVDRAEAVLQQEKVKLRPLEREERRIKAAQAQNPGSVSGDEVDRIVGATEAARAAVTVAERQLETARKYVAYCAIRAPFAGRIGRRQVDPGNRVKQDDTVLARLVQLDPIDVDFDVDDRTHLRLIGLLTGAKTAAAAAGGGWRSLGGSRQDLREPVAVGLPDRDDFTLAGRVTFVDNQVNAATSTIQLRAEVANPGGELVPGLFVRVRMPVGPPREAVLVPEEAITIDQERKVVFVVTDKNVVESRRVKPGQQETVRVGDRERQMRVVEPLPGDSKSGVTAADRVIVAGVQRVRDGGAVSVK
jgi:RND family efflux transporter MFP subunit